MFRVVLYWDVRGHTHFSKLPSLLLSPAKLLLCVLQQRKENAVCIWDTPRSWLLNLLKKSATVFEVCWGNKKRMIKTWERWEVCKTASTKSMSVFGQPPQGEFISLVLHQGNYLQMISVYCIHKCASFWTYPSENGNVRSHSEKHQGSQFGRVEETNFLNWCVIISKQTQKLREVCAQVDLEKRQLGRWGVGNSIWL